MPKIWNGFLDNFSKYGKRKQFTYVFGEGGIKGVPAQTALLPCGGPLVRTHTIAREAPRSRGISQGAGARADANVVGSGVARLGPENRETMSEFNLFSPYTFPQISYIFFF